MSRRSFFARVSCFAIVLSCAEPVSGQLVSDGGWYVAPGLVYSHPDAKVYDDDDLSLEINFGFGIGERLDIELGYLQSKMAADHASGLADRREAILSSLWRLDARGTVTPYLALGAGAERFEREGNVDTLPVLRMGAGYDVPISTHPGITLQPEIRAVYFPEGPNGTGASDSVDAQAVVRLRYDPFESAAVESSPPLPPPAMVPVKATSTSDLCRGLAPRSDAFATHQCDRLKDRDHDGVPDKVDRCPNTIPRVRVDRDGCLLGL